MSLVKSAFDPREPPDPSSRMIATAQPVGVVPAVAGTTAAAFAVATAAACATRPSSSPPNRDSAASRQPQSRAREKRAHRASRASAGARLATSGRPMNHKRTSVGEFKDEEEAARAYDAAAARFGRPLNFPVAGGLGTRPCPSRASARLSLSLALKKQQLKSRLATRLGIEAAWRKNANTA